MGWENLVFIISGGGGEYREYWLLIVGGGRDENILSFMVGGCGDDKFLDFRLLGRWESPDIDFLWLAGARDEKVCSLGCWESIDFCGWCISAFGNFCNGCNWHENESNMTSASGGGSWVESLGAVAAELWFGLPYIAHRLPTLRPSGWDHRPWRKRPCWYRSRPCAAAQEHIEMHNRRS